MCKCVPVSFEVYAADALGLIGFDGYFDRCLVGQTVRLLRESCRPFLGALNYDTSVSAAPVEARSVWRAVAR
ncbi:hypothetical protein GCM10011499_10490 [Pelagibacterium lentulum]|uniref:Uncharacterized protein n=1 Tax=Pelagibacterium lentulum TaxID=2029865 RepID=A0A916R7Z1_9HYPH|nr:hypothetical protein GCM10011499_10490 [Pelagibacterium lentulum]